MQQFKLSVFAFASLGVPTGVAHAEDESIVRGGATFGIGIGAGNIGCQTADGDDCDGDGPSSAGGLNLRAGAMLTPRLALAADLWGMAHTEDNYRVTQSILAGVIRGWVAAPLWLQGGLGVARATARYEFGGFEAMSETDYVPAVVVGVGVEAFSRPDLAIDIELKAGSGLYEDDIQIYNLSLGAAVSFY